MTEPKQYGTTKTETGHVITIQQATTAAKEPPLAWLRMTCSCGNHDTEEMARINAAQAIVLRGMLDAFIDAAAVDKEWPRFGDTADKTNCTTCARHGNTCSPYNFRDIVGCMAHAPVAK